MKSTTAYMNIDQRKKMSKFRRVKRKVKSISIEDRDVRAEGKPGRFYWKFSRG